MAIHPDLFTITNSFSTHRPPRYRIAYPTMPALQFKSQPRVGAISLEKINLFRPTLGVWAVGAGGAVALFFSAVPLFQNDILKKIPFVSTYFADKIPDSDKPF